MSATPKISNRVTSIEEYFSDILIRASGNSQQSAAVAIGILYVADYGLMAGIKIFATDLAASQSWPRSAAPHPCSTAWPPSVGPAHPLERHIRERSVLCSRTTKQAPNSIE
jgi:hypothetical protein